MEGGLAHTPAKGSHFRNPEPQQVSSLWGGLFGGMWLQGEKLVFSHLPRSSLAVWDRHYCEVLPSPRGCFGSNSGVAFNFR